MKEYYLLVHLNDNIAFNMTKQLPKCNMEVMKPQGWSGNLDKLLRK